PQGALWPPSQGSAGRGPGGGRKAASPTPLPGVGGGRCISPRGWSGSPAGRRRRRCPRSNCSPGRTGSERRERSMPMKHEITPADLMPVAEYAKVRAARRQALVAQKQNRRLEVGPVATFHFENYDSMWLQVQEMLYIEKGG